jgi:hypothetical protein
VFVQEVKRIKKALLKNPRGLLLKEWRLID